MKYIEKHPMRMIVVGMIGTSLSAIFAVFLVLEVPTILQIMGSVLILGGVLYYSRLESVK